MPIFISSIPTTEKDDLELSKSLLKKKDVEDIDIKLPGFDNKEHLFTNTGRASLYIILKALGISEGDEVIIQSFTCMALVVPFVWLDITPVYTDIDPDTYNMSIDSLKGRITDRTRAVVVQHTFGIPAEIEKIKSYLDELNKDREQDKKIYLIEDCAHCLNIKINNKYLGSFGDVSFFSFGQDKVISCTQGGCIVCNDKSIQDKVEKIYEEISEMDDKKIKYNLTYPLLWNIIKRLYDKPQFVYNSKRFSLFTIGKFLIILFRSLGLIKPQASVSNFGSPQRDVCKLSFQQKHLLKNQLDKIDRFTKHREEIVSEYSRLLGLDLSGSLIRYPILVADPEKVRLSLQKIGVISGNWYNHPVIPRGIDFEKISYHLGSCVNTEYTMEHIINLPTGIDVRNENVKNVVNIIRKYLL